MLKKFLLIVTTLLCIIQVNAQSNKAFVVGKQIVKVAKVEMKTTTEMMGQKIEHNIITSSKTEMVIISATDAEVKIEGKLKKLKTTMETNGQQMEFDSENPNENELLQDLNDIVNKTTVITGDEKRIIKAIKYDETVEKKIQAQSFNIGGTSYAIGQPIDFILLLPLDISIGKTWNQSVGNDESKYDYTYTIKSIENGIANIDLVAKITQDKIGEMQGNKVVTKLVGTMSGKIYVDIKTNFVNSRTTTSATKGTVDIKGQSSPVEKTILTEEFYQ